MRKIHTVAILVLVASMLICPTLASAQAGGCSPTDQTCSWTFTLTKATQQANIDVSSAQGIWQFVVRVRGKVNSLGFNIKDNPGAGDICWHYGQKQPKTSTISTSPFVVPAATANVCGNQWPDKNGDPLTLQAIIQTGDVNASVDIEIIYPNPFYTP